MTSQTPYFEARDVRKSFGSVQALAGVDFQLYAGEVMALIGENGAGKSTLLKILTGDYQPDHGELFRDGQPVTFANPAAARHHGLRVIGQEPEIVRHVSVAENIFVGTLGRGRFDMDALFAKADETIARWGFDKVISSHLLGTQLAPAQRQVVEILRAVVSQPKMLCFDEPTSSLGDDETELLFALIRTLRDQGVAIGYVSHRMHEIFELADRVTVLRDGELVGVEKTDDTSPDALVSMMVGRDLSNYFQRTRTEPGNVVLELEHVNNEFVSDVSLVVKAGEVVGVAGLIGAGRSELVKTIVGDYHVASGVVRVCGDEVHFASPSDAVAARIGFAPEERKAEALIMQRSVQANIGLVLLDKLSRAGFVSDKKERELAETFVKRLNIRTPNTAQLVGKLSGGNQQKTVLARWLATDPILLILDEPTRGIDVGAKSEIYAIIDELAQAGVAVLMVSSELPEVLGISDRIYVMAGGRITGEVDAKAATEESILALAIGTATSTAA